MPTLMSASTQPSSNGITAQATSARMKVIIGASRNTTLLAPVGMMVSLSSSFRPSANGCSRPNGPTTLGPWRSCIAAQHLALGIGQVGDGQQQRHDDRQELQHDQDRLAEPERREERDDVAIMPYSAAIGAGADASAVHSAMVARGAADRVGQVEVGDRRDERRVGRARRPCRTRPRRRLDLRRCAAKRGFAATSRGADLVQRVVGQRLARAPPTARAGSPSPPRPRPAGRRRAGRAAPGPRC